MQIAGPAVTSVGQERTLLTTGTVSLVLHCGSAGMTVTVRGSDSDSWEVVSDSTVRGHVEGESPPGTEVVLESSFVVRSRGAFNLTNRFTGKLMDGSFYAYDSGAACESHASAIVGP